MRSLGGRSASATFKTSVLLPSNARCSECVARLGLVVDGIPGVSGSECDARVSEITITYDPVLIDPDELERRVVGAGLDVARGVEHAAYRVTGLD